MAGKSIRFLSDRVDARLLAEGRKTVMVSVTRTGTFNDPRYGEFEITRDKLLAMVRNFDAKVYGQEIVLDVSHAPAAGAAGFFKRLFLDGNKLRGEVELTEYGIDAIQKRGMIYLSAEYNEEFVENEPPYKNYGPVLKGAALTPRPVIKRLDPIQLSESAPDGTPTLISERILKLLNEEQVDMKDKFGKLLAAALAAISGLGDAVVKQLSAAFDQAMEGINDEARAKLLMESFISTGEKAAAHLRANPGSTIQLSVGAPGLSESDVRRMFDEARTAEMERVKKLAENQNANVQHFTKLLADSKVLDGLQAEDARVLSEAAQLITADMTPDQVKRLAENQIAVGTRMAAAGKLSAMGFRGSPAGHVHISVDESNAVKKLQEEVDKRLGLTSAADAKRYARTGGTLPQINKDLADKVLADFDAQHGAKLHQEAKFLAAGDGIISDVAVPTIFERTVIRESLHSLIGLQFVDSGSLPFTTSADIFYSYRDTTAAGRRDTRVYEGGSVKRAGVIQTFETAYPLPQKLAFEVSDELRYLTSNGQLQWEVVSENQRNATRIIGEDMDTLIFNEVLNSADEFGAVAVSAESLTGVNGTNTIFALVNFPVVRPRKIFNLKGVQIGTTVNPVTVTYAAVARLEYDGTGTQAAGTYYVMDYNRGEIYFVTEAGVLVVPPNATAITVAYSRATNVYKFDTDLGSLTVGAKWDDFLYRYSLRKNAIEQDRYYQANFGLMSGTIMSQVEQATQFGANNKRNGTDLQADGNLGRVKDVANFRSTAPGLNMGDVRVVIGERANTRFRMMKGWSMSELENQKDANGRFTGKKEAYGDQFIVLHTPTPLKGALTSMVLYSTAGRVNRAS